MLNAGLRHRKITLGALSILFATLLLLIVLCPVFRRQRGRGHDGGRKRWAGVRGRRSAGLRRGRWLRCTKSGFLVCRKGGGGFSRDRAEGRLREHHGRGAWEFLDVGRRLGGSWGLAIQHGRSRRCVWACLWRGVRRLQNGGRLNLVFTLGALEFDLESFVFVVLCRQRGRAQDGGRKRWAGARGRRSAGLRRGRWLRRKGEGNFRWHRSRSGGRFVCDGAGDRSRFRD